MNINRRSVLKIGALGASSYFLPSFTWAQNTSPLRGQDPHQLLHIHLSGAADFTYLFDARPLEMTNAGLLQNYSKEEPYEWLAPTNQRKTWASPITKPLIPFRQDLSIINGIFMDRQFVGHSQNENLLFTGNPFGGTAYMPLVNTNSTQVAAPLDGLKVSNFDSYQANNLGGLLPFGSKSAGELVEKIKHQPLENQSKTYQFILERMRKAGGNKSNLALGAQRLAKGYTNAVPLSEQLTKTQMTIDPKLDPDLQFLTLFRELSLQNSVRVGYIQIDSIQSDQSFLVFDCHSGDLAGQQPQLFKVICDRLANILNYMKNTPFSAQKSLLDVTTVVISTEFGRTMRQEGSSMDETGTDHNPFCNSMILAGKGIRGGTVVGASDFQTSTEELSKAHMQLDAKKLSIMARPFDFNKEDVVMEKPDNFDQSHYLNVGCVINSLFDIFSVDKSFYRRLGNGAVTQLLPSLKSIVK